MGIIDFTDGTALPASSLDEALKQVVMKYATAAARDADAALTAAIREGMVCYLDNTNTWCVYSGSAWSTVGPVHGQLLAWTPVITQSGGVTVTNSDSTYMRIGRKIIAPFYLTVTGSGTASNLITISLPVTAAGSAGAAGECHVRDNSTGFNYPAMLKLASTTTAAMLSTTSTGGADATAYLGSGQFTAGLAVSDYLMGELRYTAAADA